MPLVCFLCKRHWGHRQRHVFSCTGKKVWRAPEGIETRPKLDPSTGFNEHFVNAKVFVPRPTQCWSINQPLGQIWRERRVRFAVSLKLSVWTEQFQKDFFFVITHRGAKETLMQHLHQRQDRRACIWLSCAALSLSTGRLWLAPLIREERKKPCEGGDGHPHVCPVNNSSSQSDTQGALTRRKQH
ncbi:hypothetical protein PAMP_002824 [Pampus punctatissimus]